MCEEGARGGESAHDVIAADGADVCDAAREEGCGLVEGEGCALDADDGGVPGRGCIGGGEGAQEGDGLGEGVCVWPMSGTACQGETTDRG